MKKIIKDYWETFLRETGRDKDTKLLEAFYFGSSEKMATELLELVLSGTKTATASALQAYTLNDQQPPQVHDLSIVTDWSGQPKCIIQTTDILHIKFKDVTFDICKREGEDETLESWQKNHIKFFNDMGAIDGYTFSWDMDIVFEDFTVIYPPM